MPATERVRRFMCAVCNNKVKARPGRKLPNKAVACEQCTAQVKKEAREEIERESPTKRFLMKFASHLSSQLPAAVVTDAMKRARGHTGGSVRITKIEKSNNGAEIEKSAGTLSKDIAGYRDSATKEEMKVGRICVSCSFFDVEDDKGVCNLVEGDIEQFGTCKLFKPGEYTVVKSQPDASDIHVDSLLGGKDEDGILCKFESPGDVQEAE